VSDNEIFKNDIRLCVCVCVCIKGAFFVVMNEQLNCPDAVFPVGVFTKELRLLIHSAFTRLAVRKARSVSTFNLLAPEFYI
jgi:hypothetical protein